MQKSLDALAANGSALVIAHRLSTVKDSDRIVVMDYGVVIESGTHDELMATRPANSTACEEPGAAAGGAPPALLLPTRAKTHCSSQSIANSGQAVTDEAYESREPRPLLPVRRQVRTKGHAHPRFKQRDATTPGSNKEMRPPQVRTKRCDHLRFPLYD